MTDYISIPKRSVWSLLGLILLGVFTYFQAIGYLIPGFSEIFSLDKETANIFHIGLMWIPVITYLLIGMVICLMVNIFKELKSYGERGFIYELIWGLIIGLIAGLIIGLMGGLIIRGLIRGLTMGLTMGLNLGLVWGLTTGLHKELK